MIDKFLDKEYLKYGNNKQRKSHEILNDYKVFNTLEKYNPILAGTIPIDIDINKSDLDIVCEVNDFVKFMEILENNFSKYENFKIRYMEEECIAVCNFEIENIEIYASKTKSYRSNAYRHMLIEYRILNLLGLDFKNKIIQLKRSGLKTEPAFAELLNIKGNPYDKLLELEAYSDEEILILYK